MTLRLDTPTASPYGCLDYSTKHQRMQLIPRTYPTENLCKNTHFFSIGKIFASYFPYLPNGDGASTLLHRPFYSLVYDIIFFNNYAKNMLIIISNHEYNFTMLCTCKGSILSLSPFELNDCLSLQSTYQKLVFQNETYNHHPLYDLQYHRF